MATTGQDRTGPICPPGHVQEGEGAHTAEELGQGVNHQEIS